MRSHFFVAGCQPKLPLFAQLSRFLCKWPFFAPQSFILETSQPCILKRIQKKRHTSSYSVLSLSISHTHTQTSTHHHYPPLLSPPIQLAFMPMTTHPISVRGIDIQNKAVDFVVWIDRDGVAARRGEYGAVGVSVDRDDHCFLVPFSWVKAIVTLHHKLFQTSKKNL